MAIQVWVDDGAGFPAEVARLLDLLIHQVLTRRASLVLSPEERPGYARITEVGLGVDGGEADGGRIAVLTSGTTGTPKAHWKDLNEELQKKKGGGGPGDRWLLTYNPGRWAGLSVLLHCLKTGSEVVVPDSLRLESIRTALARATHVSLTPSLFRKLLMGGAEDLAASPLRQVTFGGEHASQKVLDTAAGLWPGARVSHVYASTELGDIAAVSDGREGCPVGRMPDWRLTEEGELVVRGVHTGDIWEEVSGRLLFRGRLVELVNVGGAKVAPIMVENAADAVPGVLECRAYAVPNPLLGEVVGLDYTGTIEASALRRALAGILPKFAVPAVVRAVPAIELTSAAKLHRVQR